LQEWWPGVRILFRGAWPIFLSLNSAQARTTLSALLALPSYREITLIGRRAAEQSTKFAN
jgi:hypothetical protein